VPPANAMGMDETGPDIAAMTFEQALKALEDVVRRLEGGEVPLDESIGLYERGEALRRHCQARLDAAQARIDKIVAGPDGKASATVPFDAG
jgi:exodeoxyribonuclease VII small subunit